MIDRILPAFGLLLALALGDVRATTLAATTLDEQIEGSQKIFRGRVTAVTAEMRTTDQGRAIFSKVTFENLATFKGDVASHETLEFLGGTVGDEEMVVDGMPVFTVGEELILFVAGEANLACPVVGWTDGALRVTGNTVEAPKKMTELMTSAASAATKSLSTTAVPSVAALPDFEAALRQRIKKVSGK